MEFLAGFFTASFRLDAPPFLDNGRGFLSLPMVTLDAMVIIIITIIRITRCDPISVLVQKTDQRILVFTLELIVKSSNLGIPTGC